MKGSAILVAVAVAVVMAPTQAAGPVHNTGIFKALMAEQVAQLAMDTDVDLDDPALDPMWAALEERAGGRDMSFLLGGSGEGGSFPQTSGWFELIEFAVTADEPACSSGVGPTHGHYLLAAQNPGVYVPGNPTWPLIGVATSNISTIMGSGVFHDFNKGTSFGYAQEVAYGGTSDFFCVVYGFFHIFFIYNWPYVSGSVAATS